MAGHGGRRAGAGRPAGSPNRATKEAGARLSELAQARAEDALAVLAEVMQDETQTGSARIAAATALLDRGFGRPGQAMQIDTNAVEQPTRIIICGVDPEDMLGDEARQ